MKLSSNAGRHDLPDQYDQIPFVPEFESGIAVLVFCPGNIHFTWNILTRTGDDYDGIGRSVIRSREPETLQRIRSVIGKISDSLRPIRDLPFFARSI